MRCLTCQPGVPLDLCLLHSVPYLAPFPCFPTSLEPSSSSPWQPDVVAAAAHTALQIFVITHALILLLHSWHCRVAGTKTYMASQKTRQLRFHGLLKMHNPSRSNIFEQCKYSTLAVVGRCIAHWLRVGQPADRLYMAQEHTDQLYFQYSFLPVKGMCRLWQLQAKRASSASPKGKQCKVRRQAMQAQKASNANSKGKLCRPSPTCALCLR